MICPYGDDKAVTKQWVQTTTEDDGTSTIIEKTTVDYVHMVCQESGCAKWNERLGKCERT